MTNDELAEQEWVKWKRNSPRPESYKEAFVAGYRAAFENHAVNLGFVEANPDDLCPWGGMSITKREWNS